MMPPDQPTDDAHPMQRLYDRIWLLAVLALVFWIVSYVAWGAVDVLSVG